jgi:hypothetical protein
MNAQPRDFREVALIMSVPGSAILGAGSVKRAKGMPRWAACNRHLACAKRHADVRTVFTLRSLSASWPSTSDS